ncbi:MAG: DUF4384 domain-containing protein [Gallionella sp.]|nr:DUF4384 domain-containing protein [Gallionella sp.]
MKSVERQRGAAIVVVMAILALAAGLGGLFDVSKTSPRALLEQALRSADPAWGVTVAADKQELRIGRDHMSLRIHTARSGYLLVLQAGTDGKTLQLIFPNDLDKETAIPVGETVLPRLDWRFDAAGPAGEGALLVVVTANAPNVGAIRTTLARGSLPDLGAGYGAALATWRETEPKK